MASKCSSQEFPNCNNIYDIIPFFQGLKTTNHTYSLLQMRLQYHAKSWIKTTKTGMPHLSQFKVPRHILLFPDLFYFSNNRKQRYFQLFYWIMWIIKHIEVLIVKHFENVWWECMLSKVKLKKIWTWKSRQAKEV